VEVDVATQMELATFELRRCLRSGTEGARALSAWAKITDWPSSCPDSDSSSVTLVAASSSRLDPDSVAGPCSFRSCCISTRVAKCLLGFHASFVPGGDM
jgi:hypothetical protein